MIYNPKIDDHVRVIADTLGSGHVGYTGHVVGIGDGDPFHAWVMIENEARAGRVFGYRSDELEIVNDQH